MNENKNENKKGYIIFNADGSKPEATLAYIDGAEYGETIVDGNAGDIIKGFGYLAQALHEKSNMPKEMLHGTIDAAIATGKLWGSIMNGLKKEAKQRVENGDIPESPDDIDIGEILKRGLFGE